jgi:trehalose synthase
MHEVELEPLNLEQFGEVMGEDLYRSFRAELDEAIAWFRGRTVWCVNSTAKGGGVAEMLASIMGYIKGAGVDARWLVIHGEPDFFAVTKRIHNRLHGEPGDGGPLGPQERQIYERSLSGNVEVLEDLIRPSDVVIVHDPQPAGLIPHLQRLGAVVIWRCHIGIDQANELTRETWRFLLPYVSQAHAYVFSRAVYMWEGLDPNRAVVIAPSIDAFSPKNQPMSPQTVGAVLHAAGILAAPTGGPDVPARFVRPDGTEVEVTSRADTVGDQPVPPGAPLVLQVSRWDRLKDPVGVITGFAQHVPASLGAHLALAGPAASGVADDPEEEQVLKETRSAWEALPPEVRERVHLVSLPMDDSDENGAMVNALQRYAMVAVQKSLREGFGLTVSEAMWKERPVVGSRVGGIQDQIVDGESGILVEPTDLEEFGRAVTELLGDPERAARMGTAARERVKGDFLATRTLAQYARLIRRLPGAALGEQYERVTGIEPA